MQFEKFRILNDTLNGDSGKRLWLMVDDHYEKRHTKHYNFLKIDLRNNKSTWNIYIIDSEQPKKLYLRSLFRNMALHK